MSHISHKKLAICINTCKGVISRHCLAYSLDPGIIIHIAFSFTRVS